MGGSGEKNIDFFFLDIQCRTSTLVACRRKCPLEDVINYSIGWTSVLESGILEQVLLAKLLLKVKNFGFYTSKIWLKLGACRSGQVEV